VETRRGFAATESALCSDSNVSTKNPRPDDPALGSRDHGAEAPAALEPLRQEVQDQLAPLLLPEKQEQAGVVVDRVIQIISERFSGPLVHPTHLAAYEGIVPGAAERILFMTEGEQGHRHRMDLTTASFDARYSTTGLVFGFLIGIGLVGGAIACALTGHEIIAGMFVAAGAVGMVNSFIMGRERVTFLEQPPFPLNSTREIERTAELERRKSDPSIDST
jgi:uncharacterized membrane protein